MKNIKEIIGKKVLITGGAGFIGSNLAIKCLELGADVSVFDNFMKDTGANMANFEGFENKIKIINGDIRNYDEIAEAIKDKDIIFNLAAQVSHILSMEDPILDIDINCKGHITLLEACRKINPKVKIVYTGTRTQTGIAKTEMINEENQDNPTDIYGAGKLASEIYHMIYYKAYGIRTTSLRLTNIYGPRAQIKNPKYGVINFFIGKSVSGEDITIFEPGLQKRDILYVDDVVDALILSALDEKTNGEIFVLGSGKGIPLVDIARDIVKISKRSNVKLIPWPSDRKGIEVGDAILDYTKIKNMIGWEPKTSVEEGLKKTIDFYIKNIDKYL